MQYKDSEISAALKKTKVWDIFYNSMKEAQVSNTEKKPNVVRPQSTSTQRITFLDK